MSQTWVCEIDCPRLVPWGVLALPSPAPMATVLKVLSYSNTPVDVFLLTHADPQAGEKLRFEALGFYHCWDRLGEEGYIFVGTTKDYYTDVRAVSRDLAKIDKFVRLQFKVGSMGNAEAAENILNSFTIGVLGLMVEFLRKVWSWPKRWIKKLRF